MSIDSRVEKGIHVIDLSHSSAHSYLTWHSYLGVLSNRDYRGLKVQLGIIRAQVPQPVDSPGSIVPPEADHTHCHGSAPVNEETFDEAKGDR